MDSQFNNLSERSQQKIQNLINKLSTKEQSQTSGESIGESTEKSTGEESTGRQEKNVRRPPMTQIKKIPPVNQKITQKTRRKKGVKKQTVKRRGEKKGLDGAPAMVQSLNITDDRPNLFLGNEGKKWIREVANAQATKNDVKIDQQLSGNNETAPRTRQDRIEAECVMCGNVWEVSHKLIHVQDGEARFTCDDCQGRR